jgi:hypothetical protein
MRRDNTIRFKVQINDYIELNMVYPCYIGKTRRQFIPLKETYVDFITQLKIINTPTFLSPKGTHRNFMRGVGGSTNK